MRYAVLLLIVLMCASFYNGPRPVAAQAQPSGSVITRIVGRHSTIVVRAGQCGPTYSEQSPTGEILVGDMSLDQLSMKKSELCNRVKSMQASTLWAGAD